MTPQELKASILQLAIQGKLVEQRPEEGTGAELLAKILAASTSAKASVDKKNTKGTKKNSHAESRSRGERAAFAASSSPSCPVSPGSPVPPADAPFDIPESWVWVRLEELGELKNGYAFKSTEYTRDGIQVVRISDLGDNCIGIKDAVYYPKKEGLEPYIIVDGSFLICMTGSIGKMAWVKDGVLRYLNQRVGMFIPSRMCAPAYLWYFLHTDHVVNGWISAKTSTNGNIKCSDITHLCVPLPPLAEQKRIVAKIEELLPYIDRYEKAWSKLEEFNKRFPGDMQKSLLQMAIQGKLVDQRPEEGTGEELYRQIQSEKQRLIKSGKIKKEKSLPEITPDEIPFDIPESWKWVRIGNIGSWSSGATPSRTQSEYYGGSVPWLKTGDLTDGYVTNIPETITDLALEKTSLRLNPVGSVLMAMYGATIGKLGILQVEATTNQACCACIPYEGMFNKYLFYFLKANRRTFIKMGEGGAQPNISKEKIVSAILPLPPLAEQKRIVAKLEELLPLCERLK